MGDDAIADAETADAPTSARPPIDAVALMTLVGRTLMVLGGAYLLRALTEAAVWPPTVGVLAGFTYAATWLAIADRTATAGRRLSAIFYATSTVMIALPLLWEAVTLFHIVPVGAAALILTATAVSVLAAAVRTRLQTPAWLVVCGAIATSVALTAQTGAVLPFALADIVLGVVTLWIGYTIDWVWLRWPIAVTADLAVIALSTGVASRTATDPPSRIVAVQLLLLTAYLASVAIRTLVRGREVNVFEALQSAAALAAGFGGAVYVARSTGTGGALLVAIALASGAGCYAVAFAFVARHQGLRHNFYFYTSLALVLVLAGSALGMNAPALLWVSLALVAAWTARRGDRLTLTLHAAAYYVAAAIASGLLAASVAALAGPPVGQSPFSASLFAVVVAGFVCWLMPMPAPAQPADRFAIVPRVAIAAIVAGAAAAWLVALVVSSSTSIGLVATIRTGALALTALGLAWLATGTRGREAAWLVYPTLVVGAVKLLAEDVPRSSAATLFIALAVYGGALIVAPHVMRGRAR